MRQKKTILLVYCLIASICGSAQERYQRQVIIKSDTTYDINNLRYESTVVEPNVKDGMIIYVVDNPFRVSVISEKKDNYGNGVFLSFYEKSGMPQEKGTLLNGTEDGEWFYWNEKGKLTTRKIWKKGKVLKTIRYK